MTNEKKKKNIYIYIFKLKKQNEIKLEDIICNIYNFLLKNFHVIQNRAG